MGKLVRLLRAHRPASVVHSQGTSETEGRLPLRHHLRPEQRVRLRLPARQHEVQRARIRAARAQFRHRRRGRFDPDRRGAHAAHHQRAGRADRARNTSRSTKSSRACAKDEHYVVDEKAHSVSLTDDGVDARAEADGYFEPLRPGEPRVASHPEPVLARALAVQARRELPRLGRRQGAHHRRVHRARARRVDAGPTVSIRPSRPRRTCGSKKRPARWPPSPSRILFRLYKKLGGMTGTADTEAEEFHGTYKLGRHRSTRTSQHQARNDLRRPRLQDRSARSSPPSSAKSSSTTSADSRFSSGRRASTRAKARSRASWRSRRRSRTRS